MDSQIWAVEIGLRRATITADERIEIDAKQILARRIRKGDVGAIEDFLALCSVEMRFGPRGGMTAVPGGRTVRAEMEATGHVPLEALVAAIDELNIALAKDRERPRRD